MTERAESQRHAGGIGAVILAAGRSSRMGFSKVMAEFHHKPMVLHAVSAAQEAGFAPVVVVTGFAAERVEAILPPGIDIVRNADPGRGMASSLALGVEFLPDGLTAACVMLGDMPLVTALHLRKLAADCTRDAIHAPVHGGRRGNPVIIGMKFRGELLALSGDEGARRLLLKYPNAVVSVEMSDSAVLNDIDTPAEYDAACRDAPPRSAI